MSSVNAMRNTMRTLEAEWKKRMSSASEEEMEEALKMGTAQMEDLFVFQGHKKNPKQPLNWPRTGVFGKDGSAIEGVPEVVNEATYILAGCYLVGVYIGSNNPTKEMHIIAHLLVLLDGLLDEKEPLRYPNQSH